MGLDSKLEKLKAALAGTGGLAVAFSGGVDSALLLAVAAEVLGERVIAVTADSPTLPRSELERATRLAKGLGVKLLVVESPEMAEAAFRANSPERCLVCKRARMKRLQGFARELGFAALADGENADDGERFRPGAQASRELGILSPLADAALTKSDVRELSRRMGLATAELPASACLATRLPYGEEITPRKLARVEAAEAFLRGLAWLPPGHVRVRSHGEVARIEVEPAAIGALAGDEARAEISAGLRELGFAYVTVDLDGYRTGSMDEPLATRRRGENDQ